MTVVATIRGIMATTVITRQIDIKIISITIRATRTNRINGQIFNNKTDKIVFNRIKKGQTILDRIVAVVVDREVLDQEAADQEVVDQVVVDQEAAADSIVINNRTAEVIGVKPIYSNTLIINEIK